MNRIPAFKALMFVTLILSVRPVFAGDFSIVGGHITTQWAKDVTPENAMPEYPRPQMVRTEWKNLNGLWQYAISPKNAPAPKEFDGKILVPFCLESALSGVRKELKPDQRLWYRRSFEIPKSWAGQKILLHFGAVDWHTCVWVQGQKVGEHKGGYDPFTFDITMALDKDLKQEVVVSVWDPTNTEMQPVGKQTLPEYQRGFRYTATSGIWQTVWLEPVPQVSIDRLKITPDIDHSLAIVEVTPHGRATNAVVKLKAYAHEEIVAKTRGRLGEPIAIEIKDPKLWSPDSPFLYDLKVILVEDGDVVDSVDSYFGMRKISVDKDADGIARIMLNNQPIFQYGPLDQGYWPDGILTPTTDDAIQFDIQYLKDIACNMVRKHVTVEPDRWYYYCDKLGLLVWQDMVPPRHYERKKQHTPETSAQWDLEQKRMIDYLYNHPSIIMWVVFNEGWGQHDTERITKWTMEYDPSRLVNSASGWADYKVGHIRDLHDYDFHPSTPLAQVEKDRAIVLGEVGGFDVAIKDHLWHPDQTVTANVDPLGDIKREKYNSAKQWAGRYRQWLDGLWRLEGKHGLCAAVYTQITDVEHELNGFLTYDRLISKIDVTTLKKWHERLYQTPPASKMILPRSIDRPDQWTYHIGKSVDNWFCEDFDDKGWNKGAAPFGKTTGGQPSVRSSWDKGTIFLRKTFILNRVPERIALRIYSLGKVDIYLNGQHVKTISSRDLQGDIRAGDVLLPPDAAKLLRKGQNLIAVQCSTTGETKFIDVILIEPHN